MILAGQHRSLTCIIVCKELEERHFKQSALAFTFYVMRGKIFMKYSITFSAKAVITLSILKSSKN
jgi:hypothetical protein